ncbi:metal ABC transporter substrate-binding protein [Thermotoga sp. KOL6]|uniref:metal ABC transporter substrate-binding protein n=1 Tax=Thermotoga sp. KOL6 TaxID=126741 RepID=UPI000C77C717|nr:metal ABC transporter substrate-binding protein [Thermotoga sp. KOL6]PLV58718.1 metal ABC transporter substrate-binding protein [Thermotoga sp. KOL6]
MRKISLLLILLISSFVLTKTIVVTINPYYLIVSQMVDDAVEVKLLVPPNANPHLFSLKPSDAKLLENSDLIIANGMQLEPYLEKYHDKTIYVSDFIPDLFLEKGNQNPHIWLDPFFLKYYIVPNLYQTLSKKFPEISDEIKKNTFEILEGLDDVIKDAFIVLLPHREKLVVMTHPSFFYFFKEFGLDLMPLATGHEHATSFATLKKILEKKDNVIGLFREPQQSSDMMAILEKELKMKSFVLDPLGVGNEKTILELLRKNLETLKEALK